MSLKWSHSAWLLQEYNRCGLPLLEETMTSQADGPDITNYWQYFNLQRDPFTMNADAELYFVPAKWEEILDLLQYISHYKNQLMLVTGENGAGKTTLADLLVKQMGDGMTISRLSAEANFDVSRLIEWISDAFCVAWQVGQPLEQMLDEELNALQLKDKPCLLVIDNAHLLPVETLEALLYLLGQQSEHQMHLHVLLLADPSLEQTFQRLLEPSEEYLLHTLVLESLDIDETSQYLGHRLSVSGLQEDFPLTDEMITRIYRLSEGNPSRINRIARRALLDMLSQDQQTEKRGFMQRYLNKLVGCVILLVVLIAGAAWLLHSAKLSSTAKIESPSISVNGQALTDSTSVALPLPPALKSANAPSGASTDTSFSNANSGAEVVPPPVTTSTSTTATTPTTAVSSSTAATPVSVGTMPKPLMMPGPVVPPATVTAAATPAAMAPMPKPIVMGSDQQTAIASQSATATAPVVPTTVNQATNDVTNSPAAPADDAVPAAIDASTIVPGKSLVKVESATKAKPVVKAEAVDAVKEKAVVKKAETKGKVVVKATPSGAYGLELLSVTNQTALSHFNKQHPGVHAQLRVVHGAHGVLRVFYGRYPTMAAANQALTTLPAGLSEAKLWPNKVPQK